MKLDVLFPPDSVSWSRFPDISGVVAVMGHAADRRPDTISSLPNFISLPRCGRNKSGRVHRLQSARPGQAPACSRDQHRDRWMAPRSGLPFSLSTRVGVVAATAPDPRQRTPRSQVYTSPYRDLSLPFHEMKLSFRFEAFNATSPVAGCAQQQANPARFQPDSLSDWKNSSPRVRSRLYSNGVSPAASPQYSNGIRSS